METFVLALAAFLWFFKLTYGTTFYLYSEILMSFSRGPLRDV